MHYEYEENVYVSDSEYENNILLMVRVMQEIEKNHDFGKDNVYDRI